MWSIIFIAQWKRISCSVSISRIMDSRRRKPHQEVSFRTRQYSSKTRKRSAWRQDICECRLFIIKMRNMKKVAQENPGGFRCSKKEVFSVNSKSVSNELPSIEHKKRNYVCNVIFNKTSFVIFVATLKPSKHIDTAIIRFWRNYNNVDNNFHVNLSELQAMGLKVHSFSPLFPLFWMDF